MIVETAVTTMTVGKTFPTIIAGTEDVPTTFTLY